MLWQVVWALVNAVSTSPDDFNQIYCLSVVHAASFHPSEVPYWNCEFRLVQRYGRQFIVGLETRCDEGCMSWSNSCYPSGTLKLNYCPTSLKCTFVFGLFLVTQYIPNPWNICSSFCPFILRFKVSQHLLKRGTSGTLTCTPNHSIRLSNRFSTRIPCTPKVYVFFNVFDTCYGYDQGLNIMLDTNLELSLSNYVTPNLRGHRCAQCTVR